MMTYALKLFNPTDSTDKIVCCHGSIERFKRLLESLGLPALFSGQAVTVPVGDRLGCVFG